MFGFGLDQERLVAFLLVRPVGDPDLIARFKAVGLDFVVSTEDVRSLGAYLGRDGLAGVLVSYGDGLSAVTNLDDRRGRSFVVRKHHRRPDDQPQNNHCNDKARYTLHR